MMNAKFQPLFEPFTLNNGITIKNRLVVAPMTHLASSPTGQVTEQELAFLDRRATDFGLFITAATLVAQGGKAFHGQPEAVGEKDLPSLRQVAEKIQSQGAKAILQIHHGGAQSIPELNNNDVAAPSAKDHIRAMTEQEVENLVQAFGRATELAIMAGFDGVEIHGANVYVIQQFYSPQSNQRTDRWGEPLAFPLAVVDSVVAQKLKHQRPDFIIGYRFSPEEAGDKGLTMSETFTLIDALVEKPLQYLHVSLWGFENKVRRGADTSKTRIELIHQRIGGKLPLIGVGNLLTAEDVLKACQTGWAEFIALGKTVMINPTFATHIREGKEAAIEREIDVDKQAFYQLPDTLWAMTAQATFPWLPPVKGREWKGMDI